MTLILFADPNNLSVAKFWRDTETRETGWNIALDELAERAADDPKLDVCLAIPGENVISRTMRLPMKRQKDLERAAGLALDDALAAPIEDRVLAMGPDVDGIRTVCAVSMALVAEAIEAALVAGLDPDVLTVDHALLPSVDEGQVATFDLGGRFAVRTAEGGFTAERTFAETMLSLRSDLQRFGVDPVQFTGEGAPNFRTGSLAKRRPLPDLRPLALAASLVLAAGSLFLAGSLTEGLRYAGAADRLQAEAEANFSRAYPGQPIVDLERQLSGRRQTNGVASDFLPLAAALAEVIETQETTSLASLSYTDEGELAAELLFSSIPDLEVVTLTLNNQGVIVREGSDTRREDGLLVSRLFLRAP